jgi:rhodanese-related sulfurtransferase
MMLRVDRSVVRSGRRSGAKILGRCLGGFVLTLTLLGAVGCDTNITDRDVEFISVGEAMVLKRESPDATLFLDPRPADSFQQGHIPGARNLRLPDVPPNAARERSLAEADMLIVYGDNPGTPASRGLAKRLLANGYSVVRLMQGGLDEWKAQGGEVRRPASE